MRNLLTLFGVMIFMFAVYLPTSQASKEHYDRLLTSQHIHVFPMKTFQNLPKDVKGYPDGYVAIEDATYSTWYGSTQVEAFEAAERLFKANRLHWSYGVWRK